MSRFVNLIRTLLERLDNQVKAEHGTTRSVLNSRVAGARGEMPRHPRVEPLTVNSILHGAQSALHCVQADASALDALKIMVEHDVGAVLVLEGSRLIGIFSERNHARSSIRAAQSTTPIPLRELMTICDVAASPTDTAQKCLGLMNENRLRYLPVRDGENLIAILSLEDLLKETILYLENVFKQGELDQQVASLRGTYSC
jgi:CBS domain-containing protein